MAAFETVIGLEVHARLETSSKLFCACPVDFGGEPNSRVCEVCLGLPGALPVPNRTAVILAVRLARAVEAEVQRRSAWARKNYFYPDLPKGYQITQYDRPLAIRGRLRIEREDGTLRYVGIDRIHLEEDAGKSVTEGFAEDSRGVDFNRSGQPLIEIVSAPELRSPDEAHAYLVRLRSVLRVTGVCKAELEKGTLRCDANVSVRRANEPLGTRTEIKNLNSFRFVRRALAFEIDRQIETIRSGGAVLRETRSWRESSGETRSMRSKEDEQDYRYFTDPDLPALELDDALISEAVENMPELPHTTLDRLVSQYGLSLADAHRLTTEPDLAPFFEKAASVSGNPRMTANWLLSELLRVARERGDKPATQLIAPESFGEFVRLVDSERISGTIGKTVLDEACTTGRTPASILESGDRRLIRDGAVIEHACREVLSGFPQQVAEFRAGRSGVLGFFMGQVMKRTSGRADPKLTSDVLERLLKQADPE